MRLKIKKLTYYIIITFTILFINNKLFTQINLTNNSFINYQLELNWKDKSNYSNNLLCISNGKKLILIDTCKSDINNTCLFNLSNKKIKKGIYTIIKLSKDNNRKNDIYTNIVLDNDTLIKVEIDETNNVSIIKSTDNIVFYNFLQDINIEYAKVQNIYNSGQDNPKNRDSIKVFINKIKQIQVNYANKYPNNIVVVLNNIQDLLEEAQKPIYYTNKTDSIVKNISLRNKIINSINFNDERTMRVPNIYELLDIYTIKTIGNNPDSINKYLIDKTLSKITPNSFQNLVEYYAIKYGIEKIPFQRADEVFIYLFNNYIKPKQELFESAFYYYAKNKAEGYKSTLIGNYAPDFNLIDTAGKFNSLQNINSKYIILAFWDPNCSHCKKQIPLLDSIVNKTYLKDKGITIVGIKTAGEKNDWLKMIYDDNLKNWIHLEDNIKIREDEIKTGKLNFRNSYGIDQTPLFFLLNNKKQIIAKHFALSELINFIKK